MIGAFRSIPALAALRGYRPADARADLVAGLTVAAVALPQAMAYGLAAGTTAEQGLHTAVVLTLVGAVFASSRQLVNGPTNALAIATLSALAGSEPGERASDAALLCLLAGAFQVAITVLRVGDLTRYVSQSVVIGFTAGAGTLLVLDQVRNLVGWPSAGDPHDHFLVRLYATWSAGGAPHPESTAVGLGTIAAIVLLRILKRRLGWALLPELLLVIVGAAVLTRALRLDEAGVALVGAVPPRLPAPAAPPLDPERVRDLAGPAAALATLGLLESLTMAKHLSAQTGQRLDLNRQCLSDGLANVAGSFFQCIPGSGSLTRSAINHQAGAVTQWAAIVSAVAVAVGVLLLAPYARWVPNAALGGLLVVSAVRIVDWAGLAFHLRATRFDAAIVLLTAVSAIAISVEFCVLVGVFASFLLAVPRAGRMTLTEFVIGEDGVVHERDDGVAPLDDRIPIFGLEGELFFGSCLALDEHLALVAGRSGRIVVLRVKRLRNPDAVGMWEIVRFLRLMRSRGVRVVLAGLRPDLFEGLATAGVLDELDPDQLFHERRAKGTATIEAIRAAYAWLETHERATDVRAAPMPSLVHFQD